MEGEDSYVKEGFYESSKLRQLLYAGVKYMHVFIVEIEKILDENKKEGDCA